ncbi:hypothetical protein [Sphingomonas sp. ABOLE]|uniref:hypothetical protein n=1 Tax=Sphingomonas sp. ABOLE TaxID=1985878 RepID=UPI000F7F1AC5|nr:hypothetical protein [Sphingomonas sp. ABOLE]
MILALALLIQTAPPKPVAPDAIPQARLDQMSAVCRTPKKWLQQVGGEQVQFKPSPKARYEQVDCLLKQLRESIVPMKLGFVGNEEAPKEK